MPGSGASNRSWPPQPADLTLRARAADARTRPRLPAAAWVTVQPPRPPAQDATPAKGNLGVARTSTFQAHSMPVSIDESPAKRRPSKQRATGTLREFSAQILRKPDPTTESPIHPGQPLVNHLFFIITTGDDVFGHLEVALRAGDVHMPRGRWPAPAGGFRAGPAVDTTVSGGELQTSGEGRAAARIFLRPSGESPLRPGPRGRRHAGPRSSTADRTALGRTARPVFARRARP